jgi:hypothetical protein
MVIMLGSYQKERQPSSQEEQPKGSIGSRSSQLVAS